MTSPIAVIGLVWDDYDLQRSDLDLMFAITEGLDTLPSVRGDDHLIPFRTGRLAAPRTADHRAVVATGWITGRAPTPAAMYRAYVDELKERLDPTGPSRVLVATLEDGSTRWINAVPRNIIGGDGLGSDFRAFSIEWDALDPYWYGSWGALTLDAGYLLDDGEALDSGADVVVVPGSTAHALEVDTLGSADVERIRIRFAGPSLSPPGFETTLPTGEVVGFTFGQTLVAGDVLEVDNHGRTVLLGSVSRRDLLTLRTGNRHGEYTRLRAGTNQTLVLGQPTEARIKFIPTYL